MAYRLEVEETIPDGFSRCAVEELDRAIGELTDGMATDPVEAVHEARKALKMERSLLRLGRAGLKKSQRRRENAALRDAARGLSGTRDADVMIEALDGIAQRYVGQVPEATFTAVRGRLEAQRDRERELTQVAGATDAVVGQLRAVRERAEHWRLSKAGWDVLEEGLRHGYRRGDNAFAKARKRPTVENLHEWRKRAKDLWYHLRLLQPVAPAILDGYIEEAHELSNLLGDDHDLAVLRPTIAAMAAEVPADLAPVLALIDHRRGELEQHAFTIGRRIYAESAGALGRRLRRYWKAAQREEHHNDQPPVLLARTVAAA